MEYIVIINQNEIISVTEKTETTIISSESKILTGTVEELTTMITALGIEDLSRLIDFTS